MKFVGKIGEELEKKAREGEEKRREEIRKEIRERLSKEMEKLRKEGRTYKVKINDMEIEVPEGFEVVVTKEGIVLKENQDKEKTLIAEEILIKLEDIRKTVVEGIVVTTG